MRKFWIIIFSLLLTFPLIGCGKTEHDAVTADTNADDVKIFDDKQYSKQDIASMFYTIGDDTGMYQYMDCVVASDSAYGCVGAVLFCDTEQGTSNVAFFDKNGFYQQCGIFAKTAEHAAFEYVGNGVVRFKLEEDDGGIYNVKFAYTSDGNGNVCWTVEDDLEK